MSGATYLGQNRTRFRVWAPGASRVDLQLLSPRGRTVRLRPETRGYHAVELRGVGPGDRYLFRLDGGVARPDPASHFQPLGVFGPSEVVDPFFEWTDASWPGRYLRDLRFYELHVGTFSPKGTFDGVIERLADLRDLGVTAIELMPVAQFPGDRNWGYDGVYPFAVQHSYGGPSALKRLVNACHGLGLAVVLDVVYNHLGPEGNHLAEFGPYFTDHYRTPWGRALNFDGPGSDEVRRYFIDNALYWQTVFHIDALRLDAVHAICDNSAWPFLAELAETTRHNAAALGRKFHLIAESDLNDVRIILPSTRSGCGIDAQWSDDFHHSLHVLLTGETRGYYADFDGLTSLARAWRTGYAYTGQYSLHRRRRHGNSPHAARPEQFVVYSQNHDQIGNRAHGDRLATLVDFESQKLAAAATVLSPFLPLLFMGEEYGETAPFQYFTNHSDSSLAESVRRGRRAEFAALLGMARVPDPQGVATFRRSRLNFGMRQREPHHTLYRFYRELFRIRGRYAALTKARRDSYEVTTVPKASLLLVHYRHDQAELFLVLAFASKRVRAEFPVPAGTWHKQLDSAARVWRGGGSSLPKQLRHSGAIRTTLSPRAAALYERSH